MSVKDTVIKPNEDGTETYTYKLAPVSHATILSQKKVIQTKDPTKASQQLRRRAFIYSNDEGVDNEKHYQWLISKIIENYEDIVLYLKKNFDN